MSKLAQLQSQFIAFLQDQPSSLLELVCEQPPVPSATRLGIYHNAYRMRLREAIDNDHPMLGLYLGDQLYDVLVKGYIAQYPSQVKSLRYFCDQLPQFLVDNAPFSSHPILAKLAQFERLLLTSFDAEDKTTSTINDLVNISPDAWPEMTLQFHPSCIIFSQTVNAVETWQALKAQTPPPMVQASQLPQYWLVWRNQARLTEFCHIDTVEQELWTFFHQGGDFSGACELLSQYYPSNRVPSQALQLLQHWLSNDLISHINV